MSFRTDKQTLDDLMIFGRMNTRSIFEIFNKTHSRGGSRVLDDMFRNPLSDYETIKRRIENIAFFHTNPIKFSFEAQMFDAIEFYMNNVDRRTQLLEQDNNLSRKFKSVVGSDTEFAWIHNGIVGSLELLNGLESFLADLKQSNYPDTEAMASELKSLLNNEHWSWYAEYKGKKKIAMNAAVMLDRVLRFEQREQIIKILYIIYVLDVYISVAAVAADRGYVFATVQDQDKCILKLNGVYHPLLENAVGNDLELSHDTNVIFLTGANMAGKSTIMKTLSITLFLAHMGFPVPAEAMEFSVRKGMYTTINLPDNLNQGYSHFYTEVLRVKKVGESLHNTGKLIVIFDELFRGTNVKDAYDATLAVVEAFAKNRDSLFVVSTHITEVGDALRERCDNVRFLYMPTKMEGTKPIYPYKLTEGVTADRHGMVIVNNEKIVEIIKGEYHDF